MDTLTLRDGPIWWHYQSVSGILENMHAGSDKPHIGDGWGVVLGEAGRGRGKLEINGSLQAGPSSSVHW
jgi:hypothetical protein